MRLPPSALRRSCSRNTRTRLRACLVRNSARDRARLGFVGGCATRAVARPELDDGVGRRVVVASRAAPHLRAGRRREERPHRPPAQRALEQRRPARRGGASDQVARRGVAAPRVATRRSTRPSAQRLVGAHGLPVSISSIAARTPIRRTRAHRAAEARVDAELHFRQAERQALVADARRGSGRPAPAPARRRARSRASRRRSGRAGPRCARASAGRRGPAPAPARRSRGRVNSLTSAPAMKPLPCPSASRCRAAARARARRAWPSSSSSTALAEHVGGAAGLVEREPGDAVGIAVQRPGAGGIHVDGAARWPAVQAAVSMLPPTVNDAKSQMTGR